MLSLFSSSVDYPVYLVESMFPASGATAFLLSSLGGVFGESVPGGTPSNTLDGGSGDTGLLEAIKTYLEANGADNVTVTLYTESSSAVAL